MDDSVYVNVSVDWLKNIQSILSKYEEGVESQHNWITLPRDIEAICKTIQIRIQSIGEE